MTTMPAWSSTPGRCPRRALAHHLYARSNATDWARFAFARCFLVGRGRGFVSVGRGRCRRRVRRDDRPGQALTGAPRSSASRLAVVCRRAHSRQRPLSRATTAARAWANCVDSDLVVGTGATDEQQIALLDRRQPGRRVQDVEVLGPRPDDQRRFRALALRSGDVEVRPAKQRPDDQVRAGIDDHAARAVGETLDRQHRAGEVDGLADDRASRLDDQPPLESDRAERTAQLLCIDPLVGCRWEPASHINGGGCPAGPPLRRSCERPRQSARAGGAIAPEARPPCTGPRKADDQSQPRAGARPGPPVAPGARSDAATHGDLRRRDAEVARAVTHAREPHP
jgi:hypothetical protein